MTILFVLLNLMIIMAAIFFIIYKQNILRPGKYGKPISRNKTKWILGTYGGILLLSVIVLYCIPNKDFLPMASDEVMYAQRQHIPENIINAALERGIDKMEGVFISKKWSFNYGGKQLDLKNSIILNSNMKIIVEKKDENDNKIEIIEYTTKTYFSGIDYTERIKSPEIELIGDDLRIIEPKNYSIGLSGFNKEFTITQFVGDSGNHNFGLNYGLMPRIIYLRIPKDVKISESYINIQYTNQS